MHPPPSCVFVDFRGKCCAFFYGTVFREIPLIILDFFYSSTCLRFFAQRVFRDELLRRSGVGSGLGFCMENPIFSLEKTRGKKFSFC